MDRSDGDHLDKRSFRSQEHSGIRNLCADCLGSSKHPIASYTVIASPKVALFNRGPTTGEGLVNWTAVFSHQDLDDCNQWGYPASFGLVPGCSRRSACSGRCSHRAGIRATRTRKQYRRIKSEYLHSLWLFYQRTVSTSNYLPDDGMRTLNGDEGLPPQAFDCLLAAAG
jgi:hypothetical protein